MYVFFLLLLDCHKYFINNDWPFIQRVFYWFHNHTRGSSSGTGKRGVLKLQTKTKLLQPWQAYQSLFYRSKLKPIIDQAWEDYKSSLAVGTKPDKSRFLFMNEKVQEMFAAETEEVRELVEAHRLKLKEGGESLENNEVQNQRYQR